jgi:hypothetical protein
MILKSKTAVRKGKFPEAAGFFYRNGVAGFTIENYGGAVGGSRRISAELSKASREFS